MPLHDWSLSAVGGTIDSADLSGGSCGREVSSSSSTSNGTTCSSVGSSASASPPVAETGIGSESASAPSLVWARRPGSSTRSERTEADQKK